jgi:DNA-binding transcriptional LysR family regulator
MSKLVYLEHFAAAARAGGFTAAANDLGLTPAAISRSVALLERRLGIKLFERSTRRLRLTTYGLDYFRSIDAALKSVDDAENKLKDEIGDDSGNICIATFSYFSHLLLVPALAEFSRLHPRITYEVGLYKSAPEIADGSFDIALIHVPSSRDSDISRRLCRPSLGLVASPEYLKGRPAPRVPSDLLQHHCISSIREPWRFKAREGHETVEISPPLHFLARDQSDAQLDAALHGLGIMRTAIETVLPLCAAGKLKLVMRDWVPEVDPGMYRGIYLTYAPRNYLAHRVRLLVDYLSVQLQNFDHEVASMEYYQT